MTQKLIITHLERNGTIFTVCALFEEQRLLEVHLEPKGQSGILGNIYVGRVKDVVKNLNAAFIEIEKGVACYYPLEELQNPIYVKKINSPRLVQGDELLVQVEKEALKTKPPKVTTNLNFSGKYLALTTGNRVLGISKKLPKERREQLKLLLKPYQGNGFGLVARTSCREAPDEVILAELQELAAQIQTLRDKAPYQSCFACMKRHPAFYLEELQQSFMEQVTEVITDDAAIYQELEAAHGMADGQKLTLYDDSQLSLANLYGLKEKLENALRERVWLKSGGYLVIQPVEALTVIDVNSGKSIAKKDPQAHYLKVNLEAAEEIAYQLRLRNISGIVVVDFIDLAAEDDVAQLMEALRRFTRMDSVPVQVVDITRLNLVEMTRKKIRRSLAEQLESW